MNYWTLASRLSTPFLSMISWKPNMPMMAPMLPTTEPRETKIFSPQHASQ